ncbi:MAG: bifunctional folylpolyglutamate synthase/dihydrofolate synthase [Desulfuromonas sp.]|nr:MAG: bifunctional folylpolyglutamate synthase/dihydrofolate synthase [Desulfuromonas sp.]
MDFRQAIEYLYGLNQFGIKLGLENMQRLIGRLPELQSLPPLVHVAGTNGKGSVSAFLTEILRHSGLRVGLYTSPHLHCFTERIRIDGQPISTDDAANLVGQLRHASRGIPLTFFEMTTAIALLAFFQQRVDFAVIETGMGGRLDATNIVNPRLALITPISFDHQQHLGAGLVAIAAEKAGIIKSGVPVVIGRQQPEVEKFLLDTAGRLDAPVCMADRDYHWSGRRTSLTLSVGEELLTSPEPVLPGEHQRDNFAQAAAAGLLLRNQGMPVNASAIRAAAATVNWPGRLEWWRGGRRILLDAAHNAAGASCLATYLRQQGLDRVRLVCGLSGERSPAEVFAPLCQMTAELFAVPVAAADTVPPGQIRCWGLSQGISSRAFDSAEEGLVAALAGAGVDAPVVVAGSIYLVATVRSALQAGCPDLLFVKAENG